MHTIPALVIGLVLLAFYAVFLVWYGGKSRPLDQAEIDEFMLRLKAAAHDTTLLDNVRELVSDDDGKEFVMHNLVRYRPKALYPPGYHFDDSARAADRRYAKAVIPYLLRYACVPVFIARRAGRFIEPDGESWHYVAMVRYRSRRDFLRFAVAIENREIAVHKWAAIEQTHIFPVQSLISLIFVRAAVAVLLALFGIVLYWLSALD
jgi:hypothetical protein